MGELSAVKTVQANASRGADARRPSGWMMLAGLLALVAVVFILAQVSGLRMVQSPREEATGQHGSTPGQKQATSSISPSPPLPTNTAELIEEVHREILAIRERYPDDIDCREMEARFLDWVGKSEEAVAIWKECLEKSPQYAHAYVGLASVAFKRGDYEQAATWARQAIGLDPGYYRARDICAEALLNLGRPQEAVEVLAEYLAKDPRAHGLFLLGRAYTLLQDWDRAAKAYEAAVRKYPDYAEAFYALSRVYLRQGKRAEAEKILARYWELMKKRDLHVEGMPLGTDFKEASVNAAIISSDLGRIYLAKGNREEALRLWYRAIALDPSHLPAREMLAQLALQERRDGEAIVQYQKLMELDPMSLQYPLVLAAILTRNQRLSEAEQILRAFCERWPERPEGYVAIAQFYLAVAGRAEDARKAAEKAVEIAGTAANYALLAQAAHAAGNQQKAEQAFKKAVELAPGRPEWERLREMILQETSARQSGQP
ncbi:TPR repeat protein [Thermogutta terrifontis]|uniref:TPR repeat protein n=1 Tax=Thermogutta terrifontis TaxID=1331910 RepID=A0A286RB21_9BACT|nr:TPR repeat protein [Thermogutta terrifontis]